jgi:hypothetical protein
MSSTASMRGYFGHSSTIRELDTDQGKISLAKAVSRFCNAEDGGIVVVGMDTKNTAAAGRPSNRYARYRWTHECAVAIARRLRTGWFRFPRALLSTSSKPVQDKAWLS